jgi:hypothetical protein
MLIYGCNRWWNNSALLLENTSDSLVEESEAYFCHRKLFAAGSRNANRNVFRRNYGHGRGAADVCRPNIPGVCGGDTSAGDGNTADGGIQLGYPGSDNIAENNIVEDAYIGIGVDALGPADRNRMYGNIAIKNTFGFLVTSRGAGASRTPHDTVLANNVALASKLLGVYLRGAENTEVSNMMILNTMSSSSGHGLGADHSSLDYIIQAAECNAQGAPCGNGASSTHVVNSLAVRNAGTGLYIVTEQQEGGWNINHSNAYSNLRDYSPGSSVNLTNSTTVNPALGGCIVWIPDGSPMKRAGADGADVGANILYRYENGRLTTSPLWGVGIGEFPRGALVSGVNDVAGQSAFDVHQRLNVNINGCAFPAAYGE